MNSSLMRKFALTMLLVIIGGLFLLKIVSLPTTWRGQALHKQVVADLRVAKAQLETYKATSGSYPTIEQGLSVAGHIPTDPWQSEYVYRYPGKFDRESYNIFSAGPDRKADTPDDDWGDD